MEAPDKYPKLEVCENGNTYTLKNIKEYPEMSDETPCFQATLYENSKKLATVSNEGRGGCDNFTFHIEPFNRPFDECEALSLIVCRLLDINAEIKFIKKNEKNSLVLRKLNKGQNGIEYYTYHTYKFKNGKSIPIALMVALHKDSLNKAIIKLKNDGYEVMNTNLSEVFVEMKK